MAILAYLIKIRDGWMARSIKLLEQSVDSGWERSGALMAFLADVVKKRDGQ